MREKNRKLKKPFTLIEIILCLALLTLVGGLVTYQAKDLIVRTQKNAELSQLQKILSLVKSLASSYHLDIDITFFYEKQILKVSFSSDEEVVKNILKPYETLTFSYIDCIYLGEKKLFENEVIHYTMLSNGFIYPNQELIINDKKIIISN